MIEYEKLISMIPDVKLGDLVITNSYEFAGALPSYQNLIYINELKNFYHQGYTVDWVISVDDEEYSIEIEVEKGICILINNLTWLSAKHLKYLYEEQGLYTYKIVAMDDDEPFKYFVILKKRCCTRCRFRDNACCPKSEMNSDNEDTHQHEKKNERFDFLSFLL